jgi:hypothetical protein
MFTARMTKRVVNHLEPRGHVYFVWDGELPGFGVRVSASGFCSYILQYRAGSGRTAPTRRLTLGACGKLTPDEARLLAKKRFADVANGKDPAAERRGAQRTRQSPNSQHGSSSTMQEQNVKARPLSATTIF